LSFDLLQHRLVTTPAKVRRLVAEHPASFMAFDLLAVGGVDIRPQRWSTRRSRLESLGEWVPPLQLTPVTVDVDEAREWYEVLLAAMGGGGPGDQGAARPLRPGAAGVVEGQFCWGAECSVAGASGVVPGQRVARRGPVVCDGCRGRAAS
jgi:hypothetical protein